MLSLQDYLVSRIFFEPMQWFTYVFLALRPQTRQRTRAQGGMVQTTPTMAMIASGEMLIARSKVKPSKESNSKVVLICICHRRTGKVERKKEMP
jgi:hypothetical protein